ncbi:carbonic anhydrase Nec1-like [Primulina eburnea]|uniref:carbonic anhydrase Nec1-like n=1 Tax=Primulina eburnea TaxID=1245227 RepID=UPI003C6C1847
MKAMYCNILVFLILFGAKSVNAQEVDDEREFDYSKDGEKGPTKWGQIKQEWGACSNGTMQSPIDLSSERVQIILKPEKKNYEAAHAIIKNRGHDLQIEWVGDGGWTSINGDDYRLRYAHWHSPSEHTVNGRSYDMELHLVHLNTNPDVGNYKIAVVGVLYKIGRADKFISRLITDISSMMDKKNATRDLGTIDPNDINTQSKRFFRYIGSLTIPPCTQGVIWTINKKVKTVSRDQVKWLRDAVHDHAEENARPLQERNSRDVELYLPLLNTNN